MTLSADPMPRVRPGRPAPHQYEQPATGFTIRCRSAIDLLLLEPAAGLASGTIYLPDNPEDNAHLIISSTQAVSAVTIVALGATVLGPPSALDVGGRYEFRFLSRSNKWVFMGGAGGGGISEIGAPEAWLGNGETQVINTPYLVGTRVMPPTDAIVKSVKGFFWNTWASTTFTPCIYSCDAYGNCVTLLGQGPTVSGAVPGTNKFPLSSGVTLAHGLQYGVCVVGQGAANWKTMSGRNGFYWYQPSLPPPSTAPGQTNIGGWVSLWASADG